MVFYILNIVFTPTYTTSIGIAIVSGLPVQSASSPIPPPYGAVTVGSAVTFPGKYLCSNVLQATTSVAIVETQNNSSITTLSTTSFPTGVQNQITASGFYFV